MNTVKTVNNKALQKVNEAFEKAYKESRQEEETKDFIRKLNLKWIPEEGNVDEEYHLILPIHNGYFKIRCTPMRTLKNKLTNKTEVNITRHRTFYEVEKCDGTYGPIEYNYDKDETAFRYLMYYGTFQNYEMQMIQLMMPLNLDRISMSGWKLLSPDTILMSNRDIAAYNLVESWLKAVDFNKLKNLTMHTERCAFIINSNDIEKLKTVENLKIVGEANIGTDFLEKFEGIEFEHKKFEGSSSSDFQLSLALFFATHIPPAELRNRSFSFNMKHDMSYWDIMNYIIRHKGVGNYHHPLPEKEEFKTGTREINKHTLTIKMTANNLTITISGKDTNN